MRLIATADMHGYLPIIEQECDLFLIAGDFCPVWDHFVDYQKHWLETDFDDWLGSIPAEDIVGIAGNHDFIAQEKPEAMRMLGWKYLENESITIDGLKIWGTPLAPKFGTWAFMKKDNQLVDAWAEIPEDIDILLVHGPVFGFVDTVAYPPNKSVGSKTLRERILNGNFPNLRHVICGHIHEGYGHEEFNGVNYWNVSYVNFKYEAVNAPVIIDF